MNLTDRWWCALTQDEALRVRQLYRQGMSMDRLAADFGVSRATIGAMVRGASRPVLGLPNISRGRGRPRKVGIDTSPS